ncbi:haloacid dehalogenase-like hydrolase-domain-containing protein [Aspergillus egyptiacus]|nr:haloacid dehalogenase-like hydrolase-domain-containing protein [Aspergillus egyptiacus]
MAACCALGAYIIYRLISFHRSLPFPTSAATDAPKVQTSKSAKSSHSLIAIQGMTCSSCVKEVEHACLSVPGVFAARVSLQSLTARIVYDPEQASPETLAREIEQTGFGATPQAQDEENWISQWLSAARSKDETMREWSRTFSFAAALSGLVFIIEATDRWTGSIPSPGLLVLIKLILVVPTSMSLGASIHQEAWRDIMRARLNASLLSSCGIIFTFVSAVYEDLNNDPGSMPFRMTSACLLMTVIIGGRVTKCHFSQRSSQYPAALASAMPESANIVQRVGSMDEHTVSVPVDILRPGDVIRVDPEENFPVDGIIPAGPGDSVYAGSSNDLRVVHVEVCAVKDETWLGQALQAMAQSDEAKSDMSHFSDRLLGRFSVLVILVATIAGVHHWTRHASISMVLTRIATVLLCACPCTLDMGISACVMSAVSAASRAGILLMPGFHIENTANAKAIVFDKTGTLTTGELQIHDSHLETDWVLDDFHRDVFWNLVVTLARTSDHPVSRLLCAQLQRQDEDRSALDAGGFKLVSHENHPGLGLSGLVSHKESQFNVIVGNQRLLQMNNIYITTEQLATRDHPSLPVGNVYIAINNSLAGRIGYTDTIAKGASRLIRTLHRRGFRTFIMTGDTKPVATAVAESIGIPTSNVYSSLLPHEKAKRIERMEAQYGHTVMVGDNANDVPALVAATFGFLVFHRSPPHGNILARLQSEPDALLLPSTKDGPEVHGMERVLHTLDLIQATSRRMHQILWFSLVYNTAALCLASGLVSSFTISWLDLEPSSASLAMSMNSVVTLFLSLQLNHCPTRADVLDEGVAGTGT